MFKFAGRSSEVPVRPSPTDFSSQSFPFPVALTRTKVSLKVVLLLVEVKREELVLFEERSDELLLLEKRLPELLLPAESRVEVKFVPCVCGWLTNSNVVGSKVKLPVEVICRES